MAEAGEAEEEEACGGVMPKASELREVPTPVANPLAPQPFGRQTALAILANARAYARRPPP